ncbi:hypothetical protein IT568_03045 [bacterium]|nr:hypothetical protein [bacterium]
MKRYKIYPGFSILLGLFLKLAPILLGLLVFIQILLVTPDFSYWFFLSVLIICATTIIKFYSSLPLEVGTNTDGFEVRIWSSFENHEWSKIRRVISFSKMLPHLKRNSILVELKDKNLLDRFIVVSIKDKKTMFEIEKTLATQVEVNYPTFGWLETIKF